MFVLQCILAAFFVGRLSNEFVGKHGKYAVSTLVLTSSNLSYVHSSPLSRNVCVMYVPCFCQRSPICSHVQTGHLLSCPSFDPPLLLPLCLDTLTWWQLEGYLQYCNNTKEGI